jgi:hypothetical protein
VTDDPIWLLQDSLARVVRIREALAEGELFYLEKLAEDLEVDLVCAIGRLRDTAS